MADDRASALFVRLDSYGHSVALEIETFETHCSKSIPTANLPDFAGLAIVAKVTTRWPSAQWGRGPRRFSWSKSSPDTRTPNDGAVHEHAAGSRQSQATMKLRKSSTSRGSVRLPGASEFCSRSEVYRRRLQAAKSSSYCKRRREVLGALCELRGTGGAWPAKAMAAVAHCKAPNEIAGHRV